MPSLRVSAKPLLQTVETLEVDPEASAMAIAKLAYRFWHKHGTHPFGIELLADDAAIALEIAHSLRRMPLLFDKTITLLKGVDGRKRIEISIYY